MSESSKQGSDELHCPKCGMAMRVGYMVQTDSPLQIFSLGNVFWSPGQAGFRDRVALKSYLCPNCGYMEQYASNLEQDRALIMKAQTI